LGLGDDLSNKSQPTIVGLEYELVDISCGSNHIIALTKDREQNKLFSWG